LKIVRWLGKELLLKYISDVESLMFINQNDIYNKGNTLIVVCVLIM